MQLDVTDIVQRYRLALRYLWNSCFWVDQDLRNWDSVHAFRELKQALFRALVAFPIGLDPGDEVFGRGFRVVPEPSDVGLPMLQVNVSLPSSPSAGIWEPVKGPFRADEVDLTLVDLFDWTPLAYSDLRFYVVRIESFAKDPARVGQHALVDVNDARVTWGAKGGDGDKGDKGGDQGTPEPPNIPR